MVATCRVGCWCCIDDNIIEPMTVVDEEMLPEGQITSEQVIIDPNSQANVVKIAEPEAVFTVDSTTAWKMILKWLHKINCPAFYRSARKCHLFRVLQIEPGWWTVKVISESLMSNSFQLRRRQNSSSSWLWTRQLQQDWTYWIFENMISGRIWNQIWIEINYWFENRIWPFYDFIGDSD